MTAGDVQKQAAAAIAAVSQSCGGNFASLAVPGANCFAQSNKKTFTQCPTVCRQFLLILDNVPNTLCLSATFKAWDVISPSSYKNFVSACVTCAGCGYLG